jgi:2'-hydroxyisoflavone reductase
MKILVLGGTSWLGGEVAQAGLGREHVVTCLARGESGEVPAGATLVSADREEDTAYDQVRDDDWDGIVDVSWQPGFVRGAVSALASRTGRWVYVSSGSVYASHDTIGADESAAVLPALVEDKATRETYGEAKAACERIVLDAVGRDRTVIARSGLIGGPGREGFAARCTDAAVAAGLVCRPLVQTLSDVLAWEGCRDHWEPRRAGLEPAQERQLTEAAHG